jgi:hypothetical protein
VDPYLGQLQNGKLSAQITRGIPRFAELQAAPGRDLVACLALQVQLILRDLDKVVWSLLRLLGVWIRSLGSLAGRRGNWQDGSTWQCQRFRSRQPTGEGQPRSFICLAGWNLGLRTRRLCMSTRNTEDTTSLYLFGPPKSKTLCLVVGVDCLRIACLQGVFLPALY